MMGALIQVWDLFIRLFHWQLVLLIPFLWLSAEEGGDWLIYHQFAAIYLLFLIVLRVLWGFWGSKYARFSDFICSPSALLNYARHLFAKSSSTPDSSPALGHNPMGGLMVVLMLLILLLQIVLGLFSMDDFWFEGPLVQFISSDLSEQLTRYHHLLFNVIVAVVGLHIAAIIAYKWVKKQNLVAAMLHGKKEAVQGTQPALMNVPVFITLVLVSALMVSPLCYWAWQLL
jgi:cytochrome b